MKIQRLCLWWLGLWWGAVASAQAGDGHVASQWSVACQFQGVSFELQFRSPSGDPLQDDQAIFMRWGPGAAVKLPVRPALFVPARFVTDAFNHCKKDVGAFAWRPGQLLLLLPKDDRPGLERLHAVVIDSATGAWVEDGGDLGPFWQSVLLLKAAPGYRVQIVRQWLEDPNEITEFVAPDWMRLTYGKGRLGRRWEVAR